MAVEFKWRKGKKVGSLRADRCHGEISGFNAIPYWSFYLRDKPSGKIAKSRLLPGYSAKALRLYAKPWRDSLKNLERISLTVSNYNQYDLPKDYERVWDIRGLGGNTRVVECVDRAILQVLNNPDRVKRGAFHDALRKLFPARVVEISYPVIKKVRL